MKKGKAGFIFLSLSVLVIGALYFILAASQSVSITPATGESGASVLYNITLNNLNDSANFTQVVLTIPSNFTISSYNTSNATVTITNSSNVFTFAGNPVIVFNGTTGYFWFNAVTNQSGSYNITIKTTDDFVAAPATNSTNVTITISDTTLPTASFVSPTPSPSSSLNYSFIRANVTASDSGSGLKNITIYLYNSTRNLLGSHTGTSSSYFYNFTSLDDGTYYLNATAYDNANNLFSISAITLTINTSTVSACTSNWTCGWSTCINNTRHKINCTDSNSCGYTAPTSTQACVNCTTNWNCTAWTPVACASGSNQTRICTDLGGCSQPTTESRTCVIAGSSNALGQKLPLFSSSTLFWVILGIIILSIAGVAFILMRMKKKSASSNSGDDSGYRSYTPRGPPPPSFPPPGYSNPPQSYPNNPQPYPNTPSYPNQPQNY